MRAIRGSFIRLFIALLGLGCGSAAHAAYRLESIDYPDSGFTEVFGINDSGIVAGVSRVSFTYDPRTGIFTTVPGDPNALFSAVLGINDSGVMVGADSLTQGAALESGFVRSKGGTYTAFANPGWDFTEARAVGNTGLVTGYSFDEAFTTSVGFIYSPADQTFIEILPSPYTLAQGINAQGAVVGSVVLADGVACTGCPAGTYAWLRAPGGTYTFFRVNGLTTRARGISDSGLITGYVFDASSGTRGFVLRLAHSSASYQSLIVPDDELLAMPGAYTTAPQAINNAGEIVGIWLDDAGFHGFIAKPSPGRN